MGQTEILAQPWMLDVLVGAVLLAAACVKGAKGLYKSLMPLVVVVAAAVCAVFASAALTGAVTDVVYPTVEDVVIPAIHLDKIPTEDLENFAALVTDTEEMGKKIEQILPEGTLPMLSRLGLDVKEFFTETLEKAENAKEIQEYISPEQIEKLKAAGIEIGTEIKDAADTALDATQSALDGEAVLFSSVFSLVHRLTSIAVHFFLWCIFCIIFLVVFTIIKNTLGLAFQLPVIGWVDKLGGAVLGLAECGVVLFALGWLCSFVGFNVLHEMGEGTKLFGLFF